MNRLLQFIIFLSILGSMATACIEDGFDTSPSAQPVCSVDTLDMGLTFTELPTPTSRFTIRNHGGKQLNVSRIALRDESDQRFRLNVDGQAGRVFENVEIRPNDSIYVFVEATLPANSSPEPREVFAPLDITVNGVTQQVTLKITGQDVITKRGVVITGSERWSAEYPYRILDSLVVAPGAHLTLEAGCMLHFHDNTEMTVRGTLTTEGSVEKPVNMAGDRLHNVVADISFDLMASQWSGLYFAPESRGNALSHTVVRNTVNGVGVDSLAQVSFLNCRLRNSAQYALISKYADVTLEGTEVAEAASGLFAMVGGTVKALHCTFANYYLFAALRGAALQFLHTDPSRAQEGSEMPFLKADFINCIVYGLGTDLGLAKPKDEWSAPQTPDFSATDIRFAGCVFKSEEIADTHFSFCLWDTDPMYATVRSEYHFDYRLLPESTLHGVALPEYLTETSADLYGTPRLPRPTPGAYQTVAPTPEE